MTNYEKFKHELIEMFADEIGIDKYTGEPELCKCLDCDRCLNPNCNVDYTREWLNSEYEPPKDNMEVATLIAHLKREPNQMKVIKSIEIIDGMPVIEWSD